MRYIDPTGMSIDSTSQNAWDSQKQAILKDLSKLINNNKDGKKDSRIKSIQGTLRNMRTLEQSDQVYSLNKVNGKVGELKYDTSTGKVIIEYTGTSNFVHEVTHGVQFENGAVGFDKNTGKAIAIDLWDEAAAYTAQYQFDPSSIPTVTNINQITPLWVSEITDSKGNVYGPNGWANTGQYPLNANSGAYSLMIAYPRSYPTTFLSVLGHTLQNISNYIFK